MHLGFFTALGIRARSPRGFVLALCWMLLFGLCAPVQAKRIALVIGNDAYEHVNKLQKAGNDATAMARELSAAGFEVQLHLDLNYRSMVRAVEALSKRITGGDEVVVFFAGHGVQIKTGSFMLPTDIEATTESEVEKTAYGVNDLTEKLSEAKAAFALVVVDACRDNPLKAAGRSVGNSRGLSAIEPPKGQMVIYSASRGQQALDRLNDKDPNPNGVFTREFIAKMRKPGLKIEDLVRDVQDSVEALAQTIKHEQRPAIYNEARGNFYFFGPTTVQVAPPAPAAPAAPAAVTAEQEERVFWEDAKAAGNQEAYEAYLESYPKGRYASLARANLARLNAAKAAAQKLAADAAAERANKAEQDRRAADEAQKAAQRAASERAAAEVAAKEQQRLAMEAQAKEQARLALLAQESARVAAEAAQRLAAARLAELYKPGQVMKDCADCPEMVVIPVGTFEMGSNENGDERPVHRVNVPSFLIGKTEVTQGQWRAVMGSNPSYFSSCGEDCPVEQVSWNEAQEFAQRLSQKTGKQYRLPREAEWEYAARAGSNAQWSFGDNESQLGDYAWYRDNSKARSGRAKTQRVAQKRPNAFGLFDMHGNVWEWVQDCWHGDYTGAPTDGSAWTTGCSNSSRVRRGGSWDGGPAGLRSADRGWISPDDRLNSGGLRLARTLDAAAELANKAEPERRATAEAQKAAEQQRLAMEAQAKEQASLALLAQEQVRVAAEAAQKLAAARLAELYKPGQVMKDCADCPEMVVIPVETFEMGSNENGDERPVHRVNVPSFLIGKTELTQGQWKAVMGSNPSRFSQCGDDCPVERVSWNEAQEFAQRLSQKTGKQYRLPSEAEWEYAARAGSNAQWSFGDNESQLGEYAWFVSNSQNRTQRVAQKRPNAFGLYDMHGNVWEWVQDCWHDNYFGAPTNGSAWESGDCSKRVLRGGAWVGNPSELLSAIRNPHALVSRTGSHGFRVARTLVTP